MKHDTLRGHWLAALPLVALVAGPSAVASDRYGECRGRPKLDVDIDYLKGRLYEAQGEWWLSVKYEIETEDARRGRCDLVLEVTEYERPIANDNQQPASYVLPLDRPTEIEDDELEYEGHFTTSIADMRFDNPKKLRIRAVVFDRDTACPVKDKDRSISFKRDRRRDRRPASNVALNIGLGFGFGFGGGRCR